MKELLNKWKTFSQKNSINEMLHIYDNDVAKKVFHLMPEEVKEYVEKTYGINPKNKDFMFDFGFERLSDKKYTKLNKFIIPSNNGEKYYFEQKVFNKPILRLASIKDSEIEILPINWFEGYLETLNYYYRNIAENKNKDQKNPKNIKTLAVFDFDNTLFHSPDAPKNHKGNWHIKIDSLSPPVVAKVPKKDMWNMHIVNKALYLCNDPSVYCIMLTGRIGNIFEDRIKELLLQRSLQFDKIDFNEFGNNTEEYKIKTIRNLINKFPNLLNLTMWDDDIEKIEIYKETFKDKEYSFNIITVTENPKIIIKLKS